MKFSPFCKSILHPITAIKRSVASLQHVLKPHFQIRHVGYPWVKFVLSTLIHSFEKDFISSNVCYLCSEWKNSVIFTLNRKVWILLSSPRWLHLCYTSVKQIPCSHFFLFDKYFVNKWKRFVLTVNLRTKTNP